MQRNFQSSRFGNNGRQQQRNANPSYQIMSRAYPERLTVIQGQDIMMYTPRVLTDVCGIITKTRAAIIANPEGGFFLECLDVTKGPNDVFTGAEPKHVPMSKNVFNAWGTNAYKFNNEPYSAIPIVALMIHLAKDDIVMHQMKIAQYISAVCERPDISDYEAARNTTIAPGQVMISFIAGRSETPARYAINVPHNNQANVVPSAMPQQQMMYPQQTEQDNTMRMGTNMVSLPIMGASQPQNMIPPQLPQLPMANGTSMFQSQSVSQSQNPPYPGLGAFDGHNQ